MGNEIVLTVSGFEYNAKLNPPTGFIATIQFRTVRIARQLTASIKARDARPAFLSTCIL